MKQSIFLLTLLLLSTVAFGQSSIIKGRILDENQNELFGATIILEETSYRTKTDYQGKFKFADLPGGSYKIMASFMGYKVKTITTKLDNGEVKNLTVQLEPNQDELSTVEVFGETRKQPAGMDAITRMPLKPSDQIQSISVISSKLIEQQGALSVIEGVRNVPGVYTYSTYGGVKESISSRGFRGIPTLKNGVRVMTDFRGQGFPTDMQGVESIQVLKGASSVTMGQATDLGAPGGLVNIVTKTPKFIESGSASLRLGSFGLVRPVFDVQGLFNEAKGVAFRINGAYQNGGKFRTGMAKESFYINPSLSFRPDDKTTIVLETDFYNVNESLDAGTVNLSSTLNPGFDENLPVSNANPKYLSNMTNDIFEIPNNMMLGFESDISTVKHSTYTASLKRYVNDDRNIYIRGAFYRSVFDSDGIRTSLKRVDPLGHENPRPNVFSRSIGHNSTRLDKNSVIQFDLVGEDVNTGSIKHTFMIGADYKINDLTTPSYNTINIPGTIDVFDIESISNKLPSGTADFTKIGETISKTTNMGITVQDVIQLNDYIRAFGAVRYSTNQSSDPLSSSITRTNFWNPLGGVMVKVKEGFNVFASYTNSTKPENVSQMDENGDTFGNSTIDQFETGIKSDWLDNRLRFNLTLYRIQQKNLIQQLYEDANTPVVIDGRNVYRATGDDRRQGIEVELTGRVLANLEAIVGYSYIDAEYINTIVNVEGSAPNNTPKHTFNGWLNYTFDRGNLKGLNIGAGVYYLGERPYNDWTQAGYTTHGLDTSKEPWYNKAYSLVNVQASYKINQNWGIRLLANNVLNEVGYDAYRSNFIDQIQPFNLSGQITYSF